MQAVQAQGAQLAAYLELAVDMPAFTCCQPGGFRRWRRTGQGVVTKLAQFTLQAFCQVFRLAKQAPAGSRLQ